MHYKKFTIENQHMHRHQDFRQASSWLPAASAALDMSTKLTELVCTILGQGHIVVMTPAAGGTDSQHSQ